MKNNLYQILGISQSANEQEIKSAYRRQAMRWHPDRNADNREECERRFKEVGYAYSVLSDPEKRRKYDETILGRGESTSDKDDPFTSESAFSVFIAVILDRAFELALTGKDGIAIYRTLIAEGCPDKIAHTIANRAYQMANRASTSDSEKRSHNEEPPDKKTNTTRTAGYYARFFARTLDMGLIGLFSTLIAFFLYRPESYGEFWIVTLISLPINLLTEALLVGALGTLPGKRLLRISVVDSTGVPPRIKLSLYRNLLIYTRGMWFGLPLLSAIPMFISYRRVLKGKLTAWDNTLNLRVLQSKVSALRYIAFIAILLSQWIVSTLLFQEYAKAALFPPAAAPTAEVKNKDVTPTQQTENYYLPLEQITVALRNDKKDNNEKFAQIKVVLTFQGTETANTIGQHSAYITRDVATLIESKTGDELSSEEGRIQLANEIRYGVNQLLQSQGFPVRNPIKRVIYNQFIVQ